MGAETQTDALGPVCMGFLQHPSTAWSDPWLYRAFLCFQNSLLTNSLLHVTLSNQPLQGDGFGGHPLKEPHLHIHTFLKI